MRIKPITPELHNELRSLFEQHPELRLQNNGYEYLSREVQQAKAAEIARIEAILKEHVLGFVKFFNFKTREERTIVLRFDYDWAADGGSTHFTGVGYLPLDHLLHGFPVAKAQELPNHETSQTQQ